MKTIDVIVSRDGSTRVETHGVAGAQCKEASQFLERALGLKQNEFTNQKKIAVGTVIADRPPH